LRFSATKKEKKRNREEITPGNFSTLRRPYSRKKRQSKKEKKGPDEKRYVCSHVGRPILLVKGEVKRPNEKEGSWLD